MAVLFIHESNKFYCTYLSEKKLKGPYYFIVWPEAIFLQDPSNCLLNISAQLYIFLIPLPRKLHSANRDIFAILRKYDRYDMFKTFLFVLTF